MEQVNVNGNVTLNFVICVSASVNDYIIDFCVCFYFGGSVYGMHKFVNVMLLYSIHAYGKGKVKKN